MDNERLASITQVFPGMPEEVAKTWLLPHADRAGFGWPPPEHGCAEPWSAVLGGRPVAWWQDRMWCCETLPMALDVMSHVTRFQVQQLLAGVAEGRDFLPQSRARIASIGAYIAETGRWPVTPVAFADSDGLSLIDGHHRLAALELARRSGQRNLRAAHRVWIALQADPADA